MSYSISSSASSVERVALSAKQTNTSKNLQRRSQTKASSVHRGSKSASTLKRSTIKSNRISPSTTIQKQSRSRAGKSSNHQLAKAKQSHKSELVSKYHKRPVLASSTPVKKEPIDLAPIVARLHPNMSKDYRKIVEQNIETADAYQHERSQRKQSTKDRFQISPTFATVVVLLLLTGFVTYLNVPNLSLRVASSQAGFSARIPGYSPPGFSRGGPLEYSRGEITLAYEPTNAETDKGYRIVERKSNWDSQSLLQNYVKDQPSEYLTYYDRGITVYIIGDDTATWINGGIWYSVESDALLNSEQLLKIASSL